MKSTENVVTFPEKKPRIDREDVAFLPAALEIVESPASPLGRTTAYVIMAIFCIILVWACLGHVDIVATAQGKIVPSGRTKVIQPFETGVIRAIHVQDGQIVKAGDVLIELDSTMDDAELQHYETDLVASQLDVARLQAELADGDALSHFQAPAEAPAALVASQRQFLIEQTAEQKDKLAVFDRQRQQKEAEHATIEATIEKLQASLPILQERVEIRKILFDHTTGSKVNYLELLQSYVEEQHDLEVEKRHYDETTAAMAAIDQQRSQSIEEFRRTRYSELVEAQRKEKGLREDVMKAQHREALQSLTAPVDGTIQQLSIHTVGGVVTPAQTLLVLVPSDSHIEIEAMLQNRDIGFIYPGQDVEIKVDAFNFNRYGLIHGKVISVSSDAITREKPPGKSDDKTKTAEDETSEPSGQELLYAARISLDTTHMRVEDKLVDLSPGMAVTAEIKTGSRTIISYLLSPLLRRSQEAFRER